MLKSDPKTEVAQAEDYDVKLTILADGFASGSKRDIRVARTLQNLAVRATKSLAEQRRITWKNASKRKYDFRLYYVRADLGISRKVTRLLFGRTFHLSFYNSASQGYAERANIRTLAHESYHLEIGKLGSHISPETEMQSSPALFRILNETSAYSFGTCTALRSEGLSKRKDIFILPMSIANGTVRGGTMTDAQMRIILKDQQEMKMAETGPYGPSFFLSLWDEYAGEATEIKRGDPAADKFFDLCANHIAHPHDIWPVLWALANDGKDSHEFTPTAGEVEPGPQS